MIWSPDAGLPPPNEAIATGGAGTIGRWQDAPWRTRAQNPKDAIEHATAIYPPNAARLVRQHRLDRGPFIIAEFVAHDLKLQFRSLNHVHGNSIKPHKLAAKPLMLWIYFRFWRTQTLFDAVGMSQTCHQQTPERTRRGEASRALGLVPWILRQHFLF